jgi:DHA2 family multidrug resistance protein
MLQSLYGYTTTDAGLVLGPGAMVIAILAPVIVRLVSRIPVARLLAVGFTVVGVAMWYFASFNLATDYAREA